MKQCEHCGTDFTPRNNKQRFCNAWCRTHHKGSYEKRRYKYVQRPKKDYHPGKVKCLKCDMIFNAWDTTLNRICPRCSSHSNDIRLGVDGYFLELATHFA